MQDGLVVRMFVGKQVSCKVLFIVTLFVARSKNPALDVFPDSFDVVCMYACHWVNKVLRVVYHEVCVSLVLQGTVRPPRVTINSSAWQNVLFAQWDEGGGVALLDR